ncbi:hypothetical protein H4R33_002619 [Dimargaris cristalligena]|nr:hypothetical protein H4R33_002619 [Dimargaris cristalligena]
MSRNPHPSVLRSEFQQQGDRYLRELAALAKETVRSSECHSKTCQIVKNAAAAESSIKNTQLNLDRSRAVLEQLLDR